MSAFFVAGFNAGFVAKPHRSSVELMMRAIIMAGPDTVRRVNAEMDRLDPKWEHRELHDNREPKP